MPGELVPVLVGAILGVPAQLPGSSHDPEAVRDRAEDILDREEFQEPSRSVIERIVDWIGDLLPDGGGGQPTTGAPTAGSGGSSLVTIVVLVVAVAALTYALRMLVRSGRLRRRPRDEEPAVDLVEYRSAREWDAAAAAHEAAGEWTDALRCRFAALVARLGDDGLVPEQPGRTAGELRGDVGGSLPAGAADFVAASELFERAWYGGVETGPEESRRFAEHAGRVRAAAEAAAADKAERDRRDRDQQDRDRVEEVVGA